MAEILSIIIPAVAGFVAGILIFAILNKSPYLKEIVKARKNRDKGGMLMLIVTPDGAIIPEYHQADGTDTFRSKKVEGEWVGLEQVRPASFLGIPCYICHTELGHVLPIDIAKTLQRLKQIYPDRDMLDIIKARSIMLKVMDAIDVIVKELEQLTDIKHEIKAKDRILMNGKATVGDLKRAFKGITPKSLFDKERYKHVSDALAIIKYIASDDATAEDLHSKKREIEEKIKVSKDQLAGKVTLNTLVDLENLNKFASIEGMYNPELLKKITTSAYMTGTYQASKVDLARMTMVARALSMNWRVIIFGIVALIIITVLIFVFGKQIAGADFNNVQMPFSDLFTKP